MEIRIQSKDSVYSITIGYSTSWFGQMHFFGIAREYYDNGEVYFAESVFHS